MSNVLERKLSRINEAYDNLKLRMASNNIWVYPNMSINAVYNKLLDFKEDTETIESVELMTIEGLTVSVLTNLRRTDYIVNLDRTMTINNVPTITDDDYSNGLLDILKSTMTSPEYMTALIEDQQLLKLICEDEYGANQLAKYYTAYVKYQSIITQYTEALNTMNQYCDKLDDEFTVLVDAPKLTAVSGMMNNIANMFNNVSEYMGILYSNLSILFDNPEIIDYVLNCKNAFEIFSNLLTSSAIEVMGQEMVDVILNKYPALLDNGDIISNYINYYNFYLFKNDSCYDFSIIQKNSPNRCWWTVSRPETGIQVYSNGGFQLSNIYFYSSTPIDLTNVDKVSILGMTNAHKQYGGAENHPYSTPRVGVFIARSPDDIVATNVPISSTSDVSYVSNPTGVSYNTRGGQKIISLDTTEYFGKYYIGCFFAGPTGDKTYSTNTCYEIYINKKES